jgi:hypothetical protein
MMEAPKLYRANALLPFSALELPWTGTDETGKTVPLRLEDAPADGDQMIGFLPIFGNKEAADKWANGRFSVEEVELRTPAPVAQRRPAYATVAQPPAPVPTTDNTVTVDPNAPRPGRRRRR